ncbi:MAG TPA: aminoacyl-tRNA hydrolase [Terracidiphilus sp.]|nr:aminoacyl-tRNA hydrolase [Terracidiphilus sp.]
MSQAIESTNPGPVQSSTQATAGDQRASSRRGPFLIVGLGNPGPEYFWTPHNAGFMAIDRIAEQQGVVVQNRRCRAVTATCRLAGREVVLAKPETFMNLSGLAVAALVLELEADSQRDLLVIYDELDLPLGTVRIKERGSPAGHNGATSVTNALGSQEWLRLRIGVGLNLPPEALAAGAGKRPGRDYLLSPMRKADLVVLDEVLDKVAKATRQIVAEGPGPAMNEFNRKDDRDRD